MATQGGRTNTSVAHHLRKEPYRFEFFQAVRLLERIVRNESGDRKLRPIGTNAPPSEEVVRFRASVSRSFPPGEIDQLKAGDRDLDRPAYEMIVGFMGLFGPSGVLPTHYTQMVIDRSRQKDYALRDFLDVFNHRMISHFFRAWEKYRLPIAYERNQLWNRDQDDPFSRALYGLVGLGTSRLRRRMEVDDETFVYFSGYFAHAPKNAESLTAMLTEFLGMPLEVQQFQGQWLYLEPPNRSLLPTAGRPLGQNCQLGRNIIVGDRVWSIESRFRIRLGPLSLTEFRSLMPGGDTLRNLAQLVRTFVGLSLDFDVQPVLRGSEVPELVLDSQNPVRLGYDTWIFSEQLDHDADDAVFLPSGAPSR